MHSLRLFLVILMLALTTGQTQADWYVANSNSNTISLSLQGSNCASFVGTVPVGANPAGIAVNAAGTRLYVTNMGSGTVSVIDTTNTLIPAVIATVPIGTNPTGIAVNPSGTRVYVTQQGTGRVSVMDTAGNAVIASTLVFGQTNGSSGISVSPDGTRVYVATSGGLSVINAVNNTVVTTVPVGTNPVGVAVSPDGTRVYVANFSGSVAVLDTINNTVIATIPVAGGLFAVAVNPTSTRAYVVSNLNSGGFPLPGKLAVIDTANNTVVASLTVGANPYAVAVNRTHIFVSNSGGGINDGSVSVFDAPTNGFIQTFTGVGSIPAGVATFLAPALPPLPTNVEVTGIEVTQGIQDLANHVPLISGRKTFVRVHVKANGAVPGVTATLFGVRQRCLGSGCLRSVIGSLVPANTVGPRITVKHSPKRSIIDDSFLFELPWTWVLESPLDLYVLLHTDPGPPAETCRTDAPYAPNFFELGIPLQIQFIRLSYFLAGTQITTSVAEQNQSESWIRRTYPVSNLISSLDYFLFDGPLSTRVDQSAKECQEMKAEDRNQCAQRYITTKLAGLQVAGLWPLPSAAVGDADGAYALIPQALNGQCALAPDGSRPCFTRGACCDNRVGAGPIGTRIVPGPTGSRTIVDYVDYAAHEIGHLLGRQHPVEGASICGHSESDPNYPYPLSVIRPLFPYDPETGLVGFDGGDSSLSPTMPKRVLSGFGYWYDFMGYCDPLWTSDYTYNNLYTSLRALHPEISRAQMESRGVTGKSAANVRQMVALQTSAPQLGDWLTVFGTITPGLTTPGYIQARRVDRVLSIPSRTPGNYSIRLIGAGGVILADYPFTPQPMADAETIGSSSPALSFGHVVPFVVGTQEIQIVDISAGNGVIGTKTVSPNPPVISNVALQGAPDPTTGAVAVAWTTSDPEGDSLTFDIFFTRDGGASFLPLMLGVSGTSAQVDTARLSGGIGQFRVIVTDGVQSAFADTPPFTLANKPPQPRILNPGDGTSIHVGQLVNLEGQATDPQDGVIPDTGLSWSTAGRSLGTGARLSITDLPLGISQLTLTATNSLGLTAETSVAVNVKDIVVLPGPTLAAGPLQIGWHVGVGESQLQTAELYISNSGGGNLQFTAQSSAPWLSLSATSGAAPLTLTLTANPVGFGDGTTAEANVVLTAVGLPGQEIMIPVTLSVGNTFVVGKTSTPEGEDQCPNDPNKTTPGVCGCGVADTDSDGDGTPDCQDQCPNDSNKVQAGACGCGIADTEAGRSCTTEQPGVCSLGITVCANGTRSCQQNLQPTAEACDGLDNDCNGIVDDGNPGGGATCSTGLLGVCSAGIQACANGALVCQQTTQASTEICGNGVDEDCNGSDLACEPPPGDACLSTTVLDNFNRADGNIGGNWRGATGTSFYRVVGNRLDVRLGGPLYWNPAAFGTSQAAFVTLSSVDTKSPSQGVLLKVQSGTVPNAGAISVVYDAAVKAVRVSTLRLGTLSWTPYGNTAVLFTNGDKLGACAKANGEVRVYKNDALVKTVTLNAADQGFFNTKGGKVGIWSVLAPQAFLDNFAGATIAP